MIRNELALIAARTPIGFGLTMRLLVTGGGGFIGANFVRGTLGERPQVSLTVLDALDCAASRGSLAGVADQNPPVPGRRDRHRIDEPFVGEADAVVHFAAETHVDNALVDPEPFFRANVVGIWV